MQSELKRSPSAPQPYLARFPPPVDRGEKLTPRCHPPPRSREGGAAGLSEGEPARPPARLGTAAERRDSFSEPGKRRGIPPRGVTCPAPWGCRKLKTNPRALVGARRGPRRHRRWGAGLEGPARRPGGWARGARDEAGAVRPSRPRRGAGAGCRPGGTAEAAGPRRQARTPPPHPVPSGPRRHGPVGASPAR